jgi:hypothetical protein
MLLPDPATEFRDDELTLSEGQVDARFPWTHKKEPVDFH